MKKSLLSLLLLLMTTCWASAQECLKTWIDAGSKQGFYAAYSALYQLPLASNFDLNAAFSFQWENCPMTDKTESIHAISLQATNYFPLNESSTRDFNTLALHQKLMYRDLSVWGVNEYDAALSLSYRRARFYGELGCMHRVLQDIHWTGEGASARYLNEPFGLVYRLDYSLFDPRKAPLWNMAFSFSDYDDFVWERLYTPNVALLAHWQFNERHRLFSKLMYMPSGVFNLASSVYQVYFRIGISCDIR